MDKEVKEKMKDVSKWYGDAVDYWKNIPATVEGMLGGYDSISRIDVEGSKGFIRKLQASGILKSDLNKALDCGAGIGRVAKYVLMPLFEYVDLVEQNKDFLEAAKRYLIEQHDQVGEFFPQGLQDFSPKSKHYDVIWIQWVISHLVDDDCIQFLLKCRAGLRQGGCICLKENIGGHGEVFDEEDSSVTRTHEQFMAIFKAANLTVRLIEKQKGFPKAIYQVNMYALT